MQDPLKKKSKAKDDEPINDDEKTRILRMIEQEDSEDEQSSSESHSQDEKSNSDNSMMSEQDLLNRSLESDFDKAIDPANYLRYASEKVNQKLDVLKIVDKNERSFK